MLIHWASERKLDDLGKQEGRAKEERERKNEELKTELKAAEKIIERVIGDVQGSSQGTRREMLERRSGSGSEGRPRPNGSSEVRSPAHKKGK